MGLLDTSAKVEDPDNYSLLEWEGGREEGVGMKWPEGQGGGAEVRNDFTITIAARGGSWLKACREPSVISISHVGRVSFSMLSITLGDPTGTNSAKDIAHSVKK